MRSSSWTSLLLLLGLAACDGVQQRVDVLRAKKIEIVGDDDKAKLDLETEVRALNERVATLEAKLATASNAPAPLAADAAPDAGDQSADAGPPRPLSPSRRSGAGDPGYGRDRDGDPGY